MPTVVPRERRWLRRAAVAIRVTVGILALGCALAAGVVAARSLGSDSSWVWTIAFLAGLVGGAVLMGNPRLYRIADHIERAAQEREDRSHEAESPPDDRGRG